MRIGQGYDVHAFTEGDHLMIGGVRIEHSRGFLAHSDGDVLLHAISDALLGAAALGDIGKHFPDTDPVYQDANSRTLLRVIVKKLQNLGMNCTSIDATIVAEAPKLRSHIDSMRRVIAEDVGLALDRVNVKATTSEKLGFCGRKEGIAAMASVLVSESGD